MDFIKDEAVKDLYMDSMRAALMNSGMMMLKMNKYIEAIDLLKLAKEFTIQKKDIQKLNYRMAAAYNGLKKYNDALEILEPMIQEETKDPLVKVEYNKAKKAVLEENRLTKDQKETYSKMFNPEKRKEEEQKKRKEQKLKNKKKNIESKEKSEEKSADDEDEGKDSQIPKYLALATIFAGIGFILFKAISK